MSNPIYLLTDFSCCEDFEKYLKAQNHANRALLDTLTQNMVNDWNKKACNLAILGGNLCLLDKDGKNLAAVPMLLQDNDTITRDPVTGKITCIKVKVMGLDAPVKMWMGSKADYEALKTKSPTDTVYFFTDINLYDVYKLLDGIASWMTNVATGNIAVPKAKHATNADQADSADQATNANYAKSAGTADNATNATNADKAKNADRATVADTATNAAVAGKLNNGGTIFARKSVWNGNKVISAEGYADLYTSEDVNCKFIVVEADMLRTFPLRFDTTKYTSVRTSVEGAGLSVEMDYRNNNRVRIYNTKASEITVTNIYVEL